MFERLDNRCLRLFNRAFSYIHQTIETSDLEWAEVHTWKIRKLISVVLDPTAGGGSIPFETDAISVLLHLQTTLNPVASLIIERATVEWPTKYGAFSQEYQSKQFENLASTMAAAISRIDSKIWRVSSEDDMPETTPDLTATSGPAPSPVPYCDGLVPLSPNWRLASRWNRRND